jgi:hypothetical protein
MHSQLGQPIYAASHTTGYDRGCSDAQISDPSERYINQPEKGPGFHSDAFMQAYNDGFNACSGSSNPEDDNNGNSGGTDQNSESNGNGNGNFEQSHSTGIDYTGICSKLQPALVDSCDTLVNSDGSLTSDGTHAMHCIRNGILLGTGASLIGVPLPWVLKGLSMLAAPTGCGEVVQMSGFGLLGNIGSLKSLTNLLP